MDAVNRPDVGMIERRQQARLALEARAPVGIGQPEIRQDLEGDLAAERRVASPIDVAHAAGAEQSGDLVGSEALARRERGGLVVEDVGDRIRTRVRAMPRSTDCSKTDPWPASAASNDSTSACNARSSPHKSRTRAARSSTRLATAASKTSFTRVQRSASLTSIPGDGPTSCGGRATPSRFSALSPPSIVRRTTRPRLPTSVRPPK